MRICIVGAGAAGLAAARQATDPKYNLNCVVFEQSGQIGGTWVYDARTGLDEHGLPIHTSMYTNLRTNLPKEVMGYPDYPIPEDDKSYITQQQILDFLKSYTDYFKLWPFIKLHHHVKNIEPSGENKWTVTVKDLKTSTEYTEEFDGVMICNGHYHTPNVPYLAGSEVFKGHQMHSHDYRDPQCFRNKRVLVIGAGPSGMDIALQVASTAKLVVMSHHSRDEISTIFPDNFQQKPDVDHLEEDKAVFKDNSEVNIDVVIFCTGFLYSFPFLNDKCKIRVEDNHVCPLYKHLINIKYPTMCFIGLPFYVCAFAMFDLQSRFYFEYLVGALKLPDEDAMLEELRGKMEELYNEGLGNKHAHMMGPKQGNYYLELSSMARLSPIPPVMTDLHNESSRRFNQDLLNFRDDVYKIIDDQHFLQLA